MQKIEHPSEEQFFHYLLLNFPLVTVTTFRSTPRTHLHILWQTNVSRKSLLSLWFSQAVLFLGTHEIMVVFLNLHGHIFCFEGWNEINTAEFCLSLVSLRPTGPGQATSVPWWPRGGTAGLSSQVPLGIGEPEVRTTFFWPL